MKIRYETGDLFAGPQRIIVHGCNAKGAMGSGVAKIVRDRYPLAYTRYREMHENVGLVLGDIIPVNCGDRIVINAITQADYGRDKTRVYADYDAIAKCMRAINDVAAGQEVGLPMIGAGLANGNWKTIEAIIEAEAVSYQPVVWVLDAGGTFYPTVGRP